MSLTKAEKLELTATIAPVVRSSAASRSRRVFLYKPETGEVTGVTTTGEVVDSLLKRYEIEVEVAEETAS